MPFKSKAQIKKFEELEKAGKLPKGTTQQYLKETSNLQKLPERLQKKKKK